MAGIFFDAGTTAPAATTHPSGISAPAKMVTRVPIQTSSPIETGFLIVPVSKIFFPAFDKMCIRENDNFRSD